MQWGDIHRTDALVAGGTVVIGAGAVAVATNTDKTGPILAFVGALLVALITAYTSDRRQRQQLAHDAQQKMLDRLDARLLADLAEMRTFLDDALRAFDSYSDALVRYTSLVPEAWEEHAKAHRWQTIVAQQHGWHMARRIDLRLDGSHAVSRAYKQALTLLGKAQDAVAELPPWSEEQRAELEAERGRAMQALAAFSAAGMAYLGARFEETVETQVWANVIHADLDRREPSSS